MSLQALDGVGPKTAEAAASAGIATVGDLLLRFPHRHRDRTVVPVASLELKQQATIAVEVLGNAPRPFRKRGLSIVGVKVGDGSDTIRATWFNQPWVAQKLTPGTQLLLTGTKGNRGFVVSEYEFVAGPRVLSEGEGGTAGSPRAVLDPPHPPPPAGEAELVPVHPLTEGLRAKQVREWLEQAMRWVGNLLEPLPAGLRARRGLAGCGRCGQGGALPRDDRGRGEGARAVAVRRAVPLPGDLGDAEALAPHGEAGAEAWQARRAGRTLDRVAAVRADSGSAEGVRRDRRGSRLRRADAAAVDGGGRSRARPWLPCTRCCGRWKPASRPS